MNGTQASGLVLRLNVTEVLSCEVLYKRLMHINQMVAAFTLWHTMVYYLDIGKYWGLSALMNINKQVSTWYPDTYFTVKFACKIIHPNAIAKELQFLVY